MADAESNAGPEGGSNAVPGASRTLGIARALFAGLVLGEVLDPYPALPWTAPLLAAAALDLWFGRGPRTWSLVLVGLVLRWALELASPVAEPVYTNGLEPRRIAAAGALVLVGRTFSPLDAVDARQRIHGLLLLPHAALAAVVSAASLALARYAARASACAPEDGLVAWLVTAGGVAVGCAVFAGRRLASPCRSAPLAPLGLSAAATLAMLPVAAGVTSARGFPELCARIGLGPADHGTLPVDLLLFASVLLVPALAAGAALARARHPSTLGALIAGAAAGPLVLRALFDFDPTDAESARASLGGVAVIARAASIAGAVLIADCAFRRRAAEGAGSISAGSVKAGSVKAGSVTAGSVTAGTWGPRALLGVALVVAGTAVPLSPIHVPAPWRRFPAATDLVFESPIGQFTVERTGGGALQVWRDRTRIDRAGFSRADEERPTLIRAALAHPTPFDWNDWHMSDVAPLLGTHVTPFPALADRPGSGRRGPLRLWPGPLLVPMWLRGGDGIGLPVRPRGDITVGTWLGVPPRERGRTALRSVARRLDPAPRDEHLADAFRSLVEAQRISSPFESDAERVEIPESALVHLRDHMAEVDTPGALERETVDAFARVLTGQRDVARILEYLAPIAALHDPDGEWSGLRAALACAAEEENARR